MAIPAKSMAAQEAETMMVQTFYYARTHTEYPANSTDIRQDILDDLHILHEISSRLPVHLICDLEGVFDRFNDEQ